MERCQNIKYKMETDGTIKEVYKGMQEKAELTYFTKSPPSAMHSVSFEHPDDFQPRTLASFP
jgi:hypothetical protein